MIARPRQAWILACGLGVLASCTSPPAAMQNDLNGLYRLRDARTRRVSSADANWQNGNNDRRPIDPGGKRKTSS